uniref:Uncharacterized protein n=1 Tax=Pyxicephalus adspersus TaxID=30357 RepID=A0AAV2ZQ79_PYXAD|nr:TPA: hypothetical protein GDO54_017277 [Pyxicephalus adspersus]
MCSAPREEERWSNKIKPTYTFHPADLKQLGRILQFPYLHVT